MKRYYSTITIGFILLMMQACTSGSKEKTADQPAAAASTFDLQKAKSFIDSVNTKFSEQFRNKDSAGLASWYSSDASILLSNSEPVSGNAILPMWGSMTRMGVKDFTFVTTDLTGDENFLIETGNYEMKDDTGTLVDRGKYVVVYKKENGVWKLWRDIGNTSLPAEETD